MSMTRRTALITIGGAAFIAGLPALPALAKTPRWYMKRSAVIGGFDPVAYFTDAKPVRGNSAYMAEYEGGVFHFASAENQATFESNPAKYAPQYGGYCTYAVANNYTASISPKAWTVYEDRLYLNYSVGVRRRFLRDVPGYIAKATQNWPTVLG